MTVTRTWLITGGAGFFGSHFVEHLMKNTTDKIIIVDNLNYSGDLERLRDVQLYGRPLLPDDRISVFTWDFRRPAEPNLLKEFKDVTHVLHAGGLTHVDQSIADPLAFVRSNVEGTVNVLQMARALPDLVMFHYFDTDEIYGPAPLPKPSERVHPLSAAYEFRGFREGDRLAPKNPYAASKAGASLMVEAFANTYNLPCVITNLMNLFGERQHPEKFIPKCIQAAKQGSSITIHASADKTQAGMRTYIHCRNAADAVLFLHNHRSMWPTSIKEAPRFNIVGELEVDNLQLAQFINHVVTTNGAYPGVKSFDMVDFHSSRPGHDLRYALNGEKLKSLGWVPPKNFFNSLEKTVLWYLQHPRWLG